MPEAWIGGPGAQSQKWDTESSYMIFQNTIGGVIYVYAKNGATGAVDYGGPGNAGGVSGIVTDAVINAAITALNTAGGGRIAIKEGTYTLQASIDLLSNVLLEGAGRSTYLDASTVGHGINIDGASYAAVLRMRLETLTGGGNAYNTINVTGTSSYLWFEALVISDSDQDGIAISDDDFNIAITLCSIEGADRYGINCAGDTVIVESNGINNTGDDGILLDTTADECLVSGNRIQNWTGEPIDDNNAAPTTNTVVDNNCGGDVYNSKGCGFATVQESITQLAGNGWIEVPEGTFAEALTIPDNNVILKGKGWGSIIDGALVGHAVNITGDYCVVQDIQVFTTPGGTNAYDGIIANGALETRIINVFVNGSDRHCVSVTGASGGTIIEKCYLFDPDDDGANIGAQVTVSECKITTSGAFGIQVTATGDNSVLVDNFIDTTGDDGIVIDAAGENCVVSNNNITGWTNEPVDDDSATSLVADNWAGGTVLTSMGCSLATIALAITYVGTGGWIEVPIRTFDESVSLDSNDMVLKGQSQASIINGGTTGTAVTITGARCMVLNLTVKTDNAGGNAYNGITIGAQEAFIQNVFVNGSDQHGIEIGGANSRITGCFISNTDNFGIYINAGGDSSIVTANNINTTGDDGINIHADGELCIVTSNTIQSYTNEAVDDDSGTSEVAHNVFV